jgi:hypothetical protein
VELVPEMPDRLLAEGRWLASLASGGEEGRRLANHMHVFVALQDTTRVVRQVVCFEPSDVDSFGLVEGLSIDLAHPEIVTDLAAFPIDRGAFNRQVVAQAMAEAADRDSPPSQDGGFVVEGLQRPVRAGNEHRNERHREHDRWTASGLHEDVSRRGEARVRSAPRIGRGDRVVAPVSAEGFVGAEGVDALAVGDPVTFAIFEQGRRVSDGVFEGIGVELDADQREQAPGLAVASPADVVLPVGVVPAGCFERIGPGEGAEEPGLQPLALLAELEAGLVEAEGVEEVTERPGRQEPARDGDAGEQKQPN